MALNQRQAEILEGVCQEYIKQALPVGSEVLKEKKGLPFSSATIRAELVQLERQRYLSHPYISSGRVPTDKGLRFFVDKIFKEEGWEDLSQNVLEELLVELNQLNGFLRVSQQITKSLSQLCSNLVFSCLPEEDILWKEGWEFVLQEPEFQDSDYWQQFLSAINDFEKNIDKFDWQKGKVRVYIGRENPLPQNGVSVVMTKTSMSKGIDGMIAILGPKRMDFKKNIGCLSKVSEMLENL